jgi:hypothetical protein
VKPHIPIAALVAVALLAAGCGRSGSADSAAATQSASAGDFGSLKSVCQPGKAAGAPEQGVTAAQIKVGVLTDIGFTKLPDLVDTAKVFTSWCNAAGGINGRKLVADIHDTKLLQVVQAVTAACGTDFALAGGSAALDGLGVQKRLSCLLPEFPAQTVMPQNIGSDLQAYPLNWGHSYSPYAGYFSWLLKEAYPASAAHVGILYGQSPITAPLALQEEETLRAEGATMAYSSVFPPIGLSDWTPYAEAIKSKGVRGLVFYGSFADLTKLELVLTNMNYKLDWIDANSNAYGSAFIGLAGKSLAFQHNYAALAGIYPLEKSSSNPATQQLIDLFNKYATGEPVTLQDLQGFSAWLLFAKAAQSCGSALTRRCVYEAALKQTAWTGGGLQAPVNVSRPDSPVTCFNVEQATPAGWQPAPFKPNNGAYRCGGPVYKLQGSYPQPLTLADIGKSQSDLK